MSTSHGIAAEAGIAHAYRRKKLHGVERGTDVAPPRGKRGEQPLETRSVQPEKAGRVPLFVCGLDFGRELAKSFRERCNFSSNKLVADGPCAQLS